MSQSKAQFEQEIEIIPQYRVDLASKSTPLKFKHRFGYIRFGGGRARRLRAGNISPGCNEAPHPSASEPFIRAYVQSGMQ